MPPLLLSATAALTLLQAPQAAVTGTVRDAETGVPLAGAAVALPDLSRVTTVGADGRYVLADVPAGPQHISVRFVGYAPRVLHALVPRAGELEINVGLRAAPLRLQTIEVHPAVAVRGLEADGEAFPDRSLSIAAVRNHPMLAEPDALEALGGGEIVLSPESPNGVHVRGGGSDQTAYLLDDVPVLSPYHSAGLFSAWNPDALAGLALSSTGPSAPQADGLSGTVAGVTRAPGDALHARGSLSTTQGRLTLDGPLGVVGAGFLVSVRSGFPGGFAPANDPSYLRGESGDWLAKLAAPMLGGALRVLGYDNENELDAAALAGTESAAPDSRARNSFAWHARSFGGEWRRGVAGGSLRLLAWGASAESGARWLALEGPLELRSTRRDLGALVSLERHGARAGTEAGVRIERIRTAYGITPDSAGMPYGLSGMTPAIGGFVRHARSIGRQAELDLGASLALGAGVPRLDPAARLGWRVSDRVALSGSYVRRHQLAQSLRNPESVVGNVFPADLFVAAGAGVPVARSDQAVLAVEYRPSPGVRMGAQTYVRGFDGLLLVAPGAGEPFAVAAFAVGRGWARGASLDASVSAARYAVVASYGLQWVRLGDGGTRYRPDYGATHLFDAGLILFPTATSSVRLGASGALNRRATPTLGAVEWEACNLRDRGCELGGSPRSDGTALGGARLPPYLRLDLGVRKHWHLEIGGRDAVIAVFGTVTNVLGRTNVLTYTGDPATGAGTAVDMRPLAPLVAGLDWTF